MTAKTYDQRCYDLAEVFLEARAISTQSAAAMNWPS